jgi:hypothetical protein
MLAGKLSTVPASLALFTTLATFTTAPAHASVDDAVSSAIGLVQVRCRLPHPPASPSFTRCASTCSGSGVKVRLHAQLTHALQVLTATSPQRAKAVAITAYAVCRKAATRSSLASSTPAPLPSTLVRCASSRCTA